MRRRQRCIVLLSLALLAAGVSVGPARAASGLPTGPYGDDQVGLPTGPHAGKSPRGWVLVVHGGGWQTVGPDVVQSEVPQADYYRAQGWATYNIDYRSYTQTLVDVLSAYDALRRHVGTRVKVCAWGESAGGHLVLMLAGMRRTVDCVMTQGAITDLLRLPNQPAWAPAGESREAGPKALFRRAVVRAFGTNRKDLWWWSPVRLVRQVRARLLLSESACDPKVPPAQMDEVRAARPRGTKVMLLACGNVTYTHAGISAAALAAWRSAQLELLSRVS